jgi:hypothetical protein
MPATAEVAGMTPSSTPPDEGLQLAAAAAVPLLSQHLEDLRGSGLSDAQIRTCGFNSVTDPARVAELLGWHNQAPALGPCLVIPYPGADGYARVKADRPRKDKKSGKTVKYESPLGRPNRVYVPPGTRDVLNDISAPLIITEGEKKAAKADQEGFRCIGLVGVYGWQRKRDKDASGNAVGARELIEDLQTIPWEGRTVFIVFDSDATVKQELQWAEWHLAQVLKARGAKVRVVRIPQGPAGADGRTAKAGLDDFLVAKGTNAFQQLLKCAAEPAQPEPRARFAPDGLVYRIDPFTLRIRRQRSRWDLIVRRGDDVLGAGLLNLGDVKERRELVRSIRGIELGEAEQLGAALVRLAANAEHDWQEYLRWISSQKRVLEQKQLAEATEQIEARREQRLREIEPAATAVLADPALLYRVARAVAGRGVVGERANALNLFLAVFSQVTDAPISLVVKGDSAGGKSFLVTQVVRLFPDECHIPFTSLSDRALIYDSRSYAHRTIIIFEVHGQGSEFCSYIIRTLVSEGCIRHQTVERVDGQMVGREVVKEGPTNFITTTTFPELHAENETRIWTLLMDDSPETTRAVLDIQARMASGTFRPVDDGDLRQAVEWLRVAGAKEAVVPFAEALPGAMADLVPGRVLGRSLRLRRDFPRLQQLIQVCALLHQRQRQRDAAGRVVATLADYAMVRNLVVEVFKRSVLGLTEKTLDLVKALERVLAAWDMSKDRLPTYTDLVKETGKAKDYISRWLRPALDIGLVDNVNAGMNGKPSALKLGQFQPGTGDVLPTVEQLQLAAHLNGTVNWVDPLTGEPLQSSCNGGPQRCHQSQVVAQKVDGTGDLAGEATVAPLQPTDTPLVSPTHPEAERILRPGPPATVQRSGNGEETKPQGKVAHGDAAGSACEDHHCNRPATVGNGKPEGGTWDDSEVI